MIDITFYITKGYHCRTNLSSVVVLIYKGRPHQSIPAGDPSEEEVALRLCPLAAWQAVLGESGFTAAKAAVGTAPGLAFSIK